MPNKLTIQPTEFTNVRTGKSSYGYRAYDDYGTTYSNTLLSKPADDDLDFLRQIYDEEELTTELTRMIDHCAEMEMGICIGNTYYDYDEIKDIINRK